MPPDLPIVADVVKFVQDRHKNVNRAMVAIGGKMSIVLLVSLVLVASGVLALAACMVAGQATRMEERDEYVDATARELLAGVAIE
jgi:hypothetical protein